MSDTITVRGFAGTDPEHRRPASGTEVTTFRLGSTPRWLSAQTGEWSSGSTNWYTVAAFGRLADNIAESISKGDPVVVVGRPKVRQWENDDGIKGTDVEVSAQSVGHDLTYGRTAFSKVSSTTTRPGEEAQPHAPDDSPELSREGQETGSKGQEDSVRHHDPAGPLASPEVSPPETQQPAAEPAPAWNGEPTLQRAG